MSKSNDALNAFLKNWEILKRNRPSEENFSPYGYPLSYDLMDELFGRWKTTIQTLDEKGYWGTSPEAGIADGPLAALLNELSSITINAHANGVHWMLSSRFLDVSHNIQQLLSSLTSRQRGINKEAAKILADRSANELETIIAAANSAREIIAAGKQSTENAKKIEEAASGIEEASDLTETTRSRLEEIASEAEANANSVAENVKAIAQAHANVASLKQTAEAREDALSERAKQVDEKLKETETAAKAAYASVEAALRKVRDQGLAKSFQDRSNNLQSERRLWTLGFAGAAIILLLIAIIFAVELSAMTYEALAVHLLRKIGLAAPLIWLGWYSARQVGRIAKVQEDYEYKAASALAFQSYKEEAKLGGDPEMEKKLLEHAIRTFGDNPVRLYENQASEPVTPLQAAIKELPPEKIAAILAAIGDQSVKGKLLALFK